MLRLCRLSQVETTCSRGRRKKRKEMEDGRKEGERERKRGKGRRKKP